MRMPCRETFVPYFENTESLFLHKNDTKLEFLELLRLEVTDGS